MYKFIVQISKVTLKKECANSFCKWLQQIELLQSFLDTCRLYISAEVTYETTCTCIQLYSECLDIEKGFILKTIRLH